MSKKKSQRAPVDRATATLKTDTRSDAQKASVTTTVVGAMQKSPYWASATDVQNAAKLWSATTASLTTNAALIESLRAQLSAAEAKQAELRRDWTAQKKAVSSTVTVFCGGSADMVKSFNLDVITHTKLGPLEAPSGLTVNPGTVLGEVVAKWLRGNARHGFLVQHATDPSNPATFSGQIPCTKISFKLGGIPSGTNVSFRVAAIDPASPTGTSPWSTWVVGNAH